MSKSTPRFAIPARASSLLVSERQEEMSRLQDNEKSLERTASNLSTASSKESREEFLTAQTRLLRNRDSQLRLLQEQFLESWRDGKLPKSTYKEQFHDVIEKRLKIAAEDVTMVRSRERILNQLIGAEALMEPDMGAAYIDIMTQEFVGRVKNYGSKRTPMEQTKWKTQLENWYGATKPGTKGLLWCPVLKDYGNRERRCASHIAPYRLGTRNLEHLFGEEEGEGQKIMWKFENAMIVDKTIETAFDDGHLTLIPVDKPAGEPTGFKVMLLNEDLRNELFDGHGTRTFGFLNNSRPGKRYLYYHFCSSILRVVRFQTPGWANARLATAGRVWATGGPYLRRSMLVKIGEQLGDTELPQEFLESGTFQGEDEVNEEAEAMMAREIVVEEVEPMLVDIDDEELAED